MTRLFNTFRIRLLLVLAVLLIATLGVQFYLNRREERRVALTIAKQEQALAAAVALALESLPRTDKYLVAIDQEHKIPLRTEHPSVMNVLVVRDDGRVDDSLDPAYKPRKLADDSNHYTYISEIQLPKRIVEAGGHESEDIARLLPTSSTSGRPVAGEPRTFSIPVRTNAGVNYIIIVLGSQEGAPGTAARWEALGTLLPTLAVMLLATLAAGVLVWRFTRPIQDLSSAARRVAAGEFNFRVPSASRSDEMGALSQVFNEMLAGLGRLRDVESRLNQAERSAVIGRLASAIAHEIRNPLNYINLSLDHLRTSLAPSDPQKRAVVEKLTAQLKTEVQRINARISEFLTYSRPAELEMRRVNLREIIDDALRIVEAQAAELGIETRVSEEPDLPRVVGDAESLRSLFTNLIINGVQAIEGAGAGGALTVALSRDDSRRVRAEVSDTGVGIPTENISQVFEPYYSTKETGTGLGLAIVKKAVDDHHGTITVTSKPGEGTTFTVTLPTGNELEA
ncbi:MAG: HAMP domain-containing protein [Acidobacteria bacterium]|nr:HAMP domain-containing protein [Acidobacteriota bacterium]MCA1640546.1 HAMP domain-containing protein [Acidobacteriota bacterium]